VHGPIIDGQEAYHVIVAGGEPEGVAAALAAARNGMKTLLIEKGDALGGLMTMGMLNILDLNKDKENTFLLTQGIFQEFYDELGDAFDIGDAKIWFMLKCVSEPNLTVMLNTEIIRPVMDGNTITGVEIRQADSSTPEVIRSLAVIDSTTDGDVAAAAGAPYTVGGEDRYAHTTKQGVTLVFNVSGVNWQGLRDYLNVEGNNTAADNRRARGFNAQANGYVSVDGNMRLRGPNIARQGDNNALLNMLIIFGVDALDPVSLADGIERGERELPHVVEYLRENFAGFEDAVYAGHAPRLYVRETRHFIGEYRLTVTDVLENRDHWDRIAHGSYPVDIQPTYPEDYGVVIGVPLLYSIPFRCVVPLEIDQLLIASRCASYDSLAHGSARVIPIGMVVAEACGTAVAYSVRHGITFRQMAYDETAISWLQQQLIAQGAYLVEFEPILMAYMLHWSYPGVAIMRELGMAAGGYANDYDVDIIPAPSALQSRTIRLMTIVNERTIDRGEFRVPVWDGDIDAEEITVGQVLITAAECVSLGDREWLAYQYSLSDKQPLPMPFQDAVQARAFLIDRSVLDEDDLVYFPYLDDVATNGQLQWVLAAVYTYLTEES